jgi:hypothetical protein
MPSASTAKYASEKAVRMSSGIAVARYLHMRPSGESERAHFFFGFGTIIFTLVDLSRIYSSIDQQKKQKDTFHQCKNYCPEKKNFTPANCGRPGGFRGLWGRQGFRREHPRHSRRGIRAGTLCATLNFFQRLFRKPSAWPLA